jgi:hypothetical protein
MTRDSLSLLNRCSLLLLQRCELLCQCCQCCLPPIHPLPQLLDPPDDILEVLLRRCEVPSRVLDRRFPRRPHSRSVGDLDSKVGVAFLLRLELRDSTLLGVERSQCRLGGLELLLGRSLLSDLVLVLGDDFRKFCLLLCDLSLDASELLLETSQAITSALCKSMKRQWTARRQGIARRLTSSFLSVSNDAFDFSLGLDSITSIST